MNSRQLAVGDLPSESWPAAGSGRARLDETVYSATARDCLDLRGEVGPDETLDLVRRPVASGEDQSSDDLSSTGRVSALTGSVDHLVDHLGEEVWEPERPVTRGSLGKSGFDSDRGTVSHEGEPTPASHWVNTGFRASVANVSASTHEDTLSTFAVADWAFTSRERSEEFHPYPARFIPELPRQVIRLAGEVNGPVLDPFCGSGTTLHEARRAGLDALGSDINPVAALISRVRSTSLDSADASAVTHAATEIAALATSNSNLDARFRAIPRVDHWFTEPAQLAMAGACTYLASADLSSAALDVVRAGVSAATVRISNQDSDTRYAAVEKNRTQPECGEILRQSILKALRWVERNAPGMSPNTTARVHESDAQDLSWVEDESVGLSCFSPPYPNAYEYWLYHKYRMYWLGFDPISVRGQEMGARPHYSKKNGLDERDFFAQMTKVYEELHRVLRPGALAVGIVGDSVIGGREIDNGELLLRAAKTAGLEPLGIVVRPIAVRRSSFNRAHSRGRVSEHVVIARRAR